MLGGYSGIVTDESMIQFRMLNRSKGPAMWSPRAQSDRMLFSTKWREMLESTQNLDFYQDNVVGLLKDGNRIAGVATGYVNRNPLRASAAVGDQWSDTSIVNGITEIFKYEIKAKNISVPVDAKTFTNVIHVHIKVYLDMPLLGNSLVQTTDIYYAKCIGPVKSSSQFFLFGMPVGSSDSKIKSYNLK